MQDGIKTGHPAGSAPDAYCFLKAQARSINLGGVLGFGTALEDTYVYSGLYVYSSPPNHLTSCFLIHTHTCIRRREMQVFKSDLAKTC